MTKLFYGYMNMDVNEKNNNTHHCDNYKRKNVMSSHNGLLKS